MYLAILTLPAHLTEDQLQQLGPVFDDQASGYYVTREDEHDESSPWLMRWILPEEPDPIELTHRILIWGEMTGLEIDILPENWQIEEIDEDRDWLAESYQGFQPFTLGPFFVHGSHYDNAPPADLIPLTIDAATAFGSGEHGTTAGCLEYLAELKDEGFTPDKSLDMGCGSGILAIAAVKLWHTPVMGIDIDDKAVEVAERHREMNGLPEHLNHCITGPGFDTPDVAEQGPYDLVIANILAGPLKDMAPDLAAQVKPHGYVMLSGMLIEQADEVASIYETFSLNKVSHKHRDGWATLLLQNK